MPDRTPLTAVERRIIAEDPGPVALHTIMFLRGVDEYEAKRLIANALAPLIEVIKESME